MKNRLMKEYTRRLRIILKKIEATGAVVVPVLRHSFFLLLIGD